MVFQSCNNDDSNTENNNPQENLIPQLTTNPAIDISYNSVKSGGNTISIGSSLIQSKGVVWSTSSNPTIELSTKTIDGNGNGNFDSQISTLDPNTQYYIRAYATNSNGTGYGNQIQFKTTFAPIITGNGFTDITGNNYSTLIINNKEWSSKNLAVKKYRNGDNIPQVQSPTEWANLTTGAWCYYNNDSNNENYGVLYNWYAVNDPRGLATNGWHIPSDSEWGNLQRYLISAGYNYDGDITLFDSQGVNDKLGKAIASTTFQQGTASPEIGSPANVPSTNNRTGFKALGSGGRGSDGRFQWINKTEHWWSTSTYTSNNQVYVKHRSITGHLQYGLDGNGGALRTSGFSVRLIKD
ncbi:hypothetical protein FPKKA176_contig00052-0003 [Flavobacterium psychrophilum]|nr:hypothetical protein FPN184_contig00065-0002 [Flavobacterium psychrophilum]GEJ50027.1 hypothetical protein FPKKA176_contig00052-0003 [Flavobacterium psychrophilum]